VDYEKLLEETEDGEPITIEYLDGKSETTCEQVYGLLETTREYTKHQRDNLNHSNIDEMEPEGDVIKGMLYHPEGEYQIEINPMSGITHVVLIEDRQETDLSPTDAYQGTPHKKVPA